MRELELKTRGGGTVLHKIYSVSEAEEYNVPYNICWREGKTGDWVLTDDDFVLQVLHRGAAGNREFVRTCIGTYVVGAGSRLDTEPRENRWTFSGKNPGAKRMSSRLQMVLQDIAVNGTNPVEAYLKVFKTKSRAAASNRIYRIMKTEEARKFMRKETRGALDELGMDELWILSQYKELIISETVNDNAKVSALNKVVDIAEVIEEKGKSDQPALIVGISSDDLKQIGENTVAKDADFEVIEEGAEVTEEGATLNASALLGEMPDRDGEPEVHEGENLHVLAALREDADDEGDAGLGAGEDPV